MGLIMHKGIAYSGGGIDAISEASDVAITTPADKNLLEYDATAEKWVNVENPFSIVNGALCVTFEEEV